MIPGDRIDCDSRCAAFTTTTTTYSPRLHACARQAALVVTERSEGRAPSPGEEILGANACDTVFAASEGGMGAGGPQGAFDLARFLGRHNTFRMTTFADADMMRGHLASIYGDRTWPRAVLEEMRLRVHEDLNGASCEEDIPCSACSLRACPCVEEALLLLLLFLLSLILILILILVVMMMMMMMMVRLLLLAGTICAHPMRICVRARVRVCVCSRAQVAVPVPGVHAGPVPAVRRRGALGGHGAHGGGAHTRPHGAAAVQQPPQHVQVLGLEQGRARPAGPVLQ